ncbi:MULTISPECIES: ribonuclease D [unclassified Haematospirillum]|uniref:ribonuclease D n=1 Tax=unclassified Haematospirillum TaxID=2622088 RepID=UPI0014389E19|nr:MULTISPECIES: ribonuclease D [unclassified Haematospirillum]NKD55691.1 ribonuclease D [Haematospirillum sp. H4890]NKD75216.1 ribonuclease D [Haematospirillum sp. H4485]
MTIYYHRGDLPADVGFSGAIAVDTETTGLSPVRDRLCVVQLSGGDGNAHVVHVGGALGYDCPNLKAVLADPLRLKIFHYARFDIAILRKYLGVACAPVYCTKIASRLTRTNTDAHGLRSLVQALTGVELDKQQQSSDWGTDGELTAEQLSYAASDVLYLHALKDRLDALLVRERRTHLADACFQFLPTRAELDLLDWHSLDIFSH